MIFFQDYKPLAYKPEEKTVQSFINISRYNTATIYKALVAQLGVDGLRESMLSPVEAALARQVTGDLTSG